MYELQHLLPLFDRFVSPLSAHYVVCLYKVFELSSSLLNLVEEKNVTAGFVQGFCAVTNLEYVVYFPNNRPVHAELSLAPSDNCVIIGVSKFVRISFSKKLQADSSLPICIAAENSSFAWG
jgi:hypothetical protein